MSARSHDAEWVSSRQVYCVNAQMNGDAAMDSMDAGLSLNAAASYDWQPSARARAALDEWSEGAQPSR